jgi:type I restriction enzyme S subunit
METTEYRLGDVCKLRNGYAFKSENFTNEGVPVIRISNINDNEATVDKALKTNSSLVFEKFAVKKGDILIAMSGATTGKFGRYNSEEKAYQNQRVGCFVITDEEKLSNDYLYLLLKGLKRKIESDAYGGGQPNISSTIIENYKVNLPSLKKQEKIVRVLNKAEGLIKQRKQSIASFDELLNNLFNKRFIEESHSLETLNNITKKITDGEHQKPDYKESGMPFISVVNITKGFLNFENCKFVSKGDHDKFNKRCNPQKNDILYSKVGATYGRAAMVDTERPFSLYVSVALIKPNREKINSNFLQFAMNHPFVKRQADRAIKGAGVPDLHLIEIKSFKIPLPSIEEQEDFSKTVDKFVEIKSFYQNSLIELVNLYDSLSQRAFRGDLNIVERIEISGSIKIQPKISAEVIAIDNMNKQLADFHNSIADSGAPTEIDNKLKQLDTELKLRGEIPFWDEYVKYRLIKQKQTTPFTFEKLWQEITVFPFESVPDYDIVKKMIFNLLNSDNPFLKQRFNESDKQIELLLNETTSA